MPVERISKAFKDISATFQISPLNYDLISITNENAIARSIRNLIFTELGDVPFNPALGSRVSSLLFDNVDNLTASAIRSQIENTIEEFEPRVNLNDVLVDASDDGLSFNVILKYFIVGIDVPEQQLNFVLEPTR